MNPKIINYQRILIGCDLICFNNKYLFPADYADKRRSKLKYLPEQRKDESFI
jgi:hypothetical protein